MELTADLEHEHVHKVYSQIATHFSDTRFKPWPRIAQFLNDQPVASIVADVGCGNGKYLGVNQSTYCLGSDICPELVSIANGRGHEVAVCDCLQLPYRTGMFDAVICIAVIHHLSTEERRLAALREMTRILRSGGHMLVYVWAMEQERKQFVAQDVMVPWHLQPKYAKGASQEKVSQRSTDNERVRERKRLKKKEKKQQKSQLSQASAVGHDESTELNLTEDTSHTECLLGDLSALDLSDEDLANGPCKTTGEESHELHVAVCSSQEATANNVDVAPYYKGKITSSHELSQSNSPNNDGAANASKGLEKRGYQTFQRYYHVFRRGELVQLFSKCTDVIVIDEFYDHDNWCVIGKKI